MLELSESKREKIDFLALVSLYSVRQRVLLSFGEIQNHEVHVNNVKIRAWRLIMGI
jgi:hypothetical protein